MLIEFLLYTICTLFLTFCDIHSLYTYSINQYLIIVYNVTCSGNILVENMDKIPYPHKAYILVGVGTRIITEGNVMECLGWGGHDVEMMVI